MPTLETIRALRAKKAIERDAARQSGPRESLKAFIETTDPSYLFGWFNEDLCFRLDRFLRRIEAGERPRLMLFAPPRHGKTQVVSRAFPAYALGRNPDFSVIAASYSSDLASTLNLNVQRIMDTDAYRVIFPHARLARMGERMFRRTSDVFDIVDAKGGYRSAGVGGGITGQGGNLLVLDDPIKDAKEAASETTRESLWEWYVSTFFTRQMPDAGILLIMTRWHVDDLAGRLIEAEKAGGDKWEVISYPAIAEDDEIHRRQGEALHPERFPLETLKGIKAAMPSYTWESLYQQRPFPREGGLFKRHWFGEPVPAAPATTHKVRSWDLASTANGGDWTVGVLMSRVPSGQFYIEHIDRFQGTPHQVEEKILNYAESDGKRVEIRLPEDPGQAGKFQVANLIGKLAGWRVKAERETGKKDVRAEPFAAQCEPGNVRLVAGHWNNAFLDELESFPNGKHDDQVDACTGAFRRLSERQPMVISQEALRRAGVPGIGLRL